jgi:SAM-dependent methyltransferase
MEPDVVCPAESLAFPDESFDVVASRVAAHHFDDVEAAVREMARVSRDRVLVVDNLFMGEHVEEAERLRDPSHVRNRTEAEWRDFLERAGLRVAEVRALVHPIDLQGWFDRSGCTGETAERVRALVADRIEGDFVRLDRVALRARKRS